jgi:hypothetical protein
MARAPARPKHDVHSRRAPRQRRIRDQRDSTRPESGLPSLAGHEHFAVGRVPAASSLEAADAANPALAIVALALRRAG